MKPEMMKFAIIMRDIVRRTGYYGVFFAVFSDAPLSFTDGLREKSCAVKTASRKSGNEKAAPKSGRNSIHSLICVNHLLNGRKSPMSLSV